MEDASAGDIVATAVRLESELARSNGVITQIRSLVAAMESVEAKTLLKDELDHLPNKGHPKPLIKMGVIGASGSGKSTAINTLISHYIQLPTSDANACTACPIELAWTDAEHTTAVITFVTREEFEVERKTLVEDLFAAREDCSEEVTEAEKLARGKLCGLYPRLQVESYASIDDLTRALEEMDEANQIYNLIDAGDMKIECRSPQQFRSLMHPFMESAALQSTDSMQKWPLTKKIKISVRAPLLEDGLILIDIPGTLDANPARANIAESYKAQCSHQIIVADATRAPDNPDLIKHVSDILWRGAMTGEYERIHIVVTQIDKGSLDEMERRLAGDTTYQSWKQNLQNQLDSLKEAQTQENFFQQQKTQSDRSMRRLRDAKTACMELLMQSEGSESALKKPAWWPIIAAEGWEQTADLDVDFDSDQLVSPKPLEAVGTMFLQKSEVRSMKEKLNRAIQAAMALQPPGAIDNITNLSTTQLRADIQDSENRMARRRRESKVSGIRADLTKRVAGLCSEQVSRLAQKRNGQLLDQSLIQPSAYEELASRITTVIGICAPAADALRSEVTVRDNRFAEFTTLADTGICDLLAHIHETAGGERLSHTSDCAHSVLEILRSFQVVASPSDGLGNTTWTTVYGNELREKYSKRIRHAIQEFEDIVVKHLLDGWKPSLETALFETINGVKKGPNASSSATPWAVVPLGEKAHSLSESRDLAPATFRMIMRRYGEIQRSKPRKNINFNLDLGSHLKSVAETYIRDHHKHFVRKNLQALSREIDASFAQLQTDVEASFSMPGVSVQRALGLTLQQNLAARRKVIEKARELSTQILNVIVNTPRHTIPWMIKHHLFPAYEESKSMNGKGVTKQMTNKFVTFVSNHQDEMLTQTIAHLNEKIESNVHNVATAHNGEAADTSNAEPKLNIKTFVSRSLQKLQNQYDQVHNKTLEVGAMSQSDRQKITRCYDLAVNESERLAMVVKSIVDKEQELAIQNTWDEKGLALKRPSDRSCSRRAHRRRLDVILLEE